MKTLIKSIVILALFLLPITYTFAAVPHLINYQGRLTDSSGNTLTGSYALTFRIYDAASAGNLLWEEAQTGVVVQKGIFNILLGSVTALNLAFDKPYYLEIKVGNEVMSPRQAITSAGYAIRTEKAEDANTVSGVGVSATPAPNKILPLDANAKLPAVDGSQLTGISGVLSNVIFMWNSCDLYVNETAAAGFVTSPNVIDSTTNGTYSYIRVSRLLYRTILVGKFKKIAGISTVTIQARIWANDTAAEKEAILKVDIGGQSNTVKSVLSNTPSWVTPADIDVSSLTNGITYDITIQLKNENDGIYSYCNAVVLIAS